MIPPFPYVANEEYPPRDGILQRVPRFCRRKSRTACIQHYERTAQTPGFHTCPYGFTSYTEERANPRLIYTCLRVSGKHDKRALKERLETDDVPILQPSTVMRAATLWKPDESIVAEVQQTREAVKRTLGFLNATVHEIRTLNARIRASAEEVSRRIGKSAAWQGDAEIKFAATTVYQSAALVSMRLNAFDFHVNPERIKQQAPEPIPIHRRFHKVRRILDSEAVRILFSGECHNTVLGYAIFDMLPFLLLDNAMKLSPQGSRIEVSFDFNENTSQIVIRNTGPMISQEELPRLTEFGFRGQGAADCSVGDGIGLALAKEICDLHEIRMTLEAAPTHPESSLAEFAARIDFDRTKLGTDTAIDV